MSGLLVTLVPIYFHLGLTKCASTLLQEYFRAHPQINFTDRDLTLKQFVVRNSLDFCPDAARDFLATSSSNDDSVNVHSHERLSGNPHAGHYDAQAIAERIKESCPNSKIVICIREQYDLMVSCYKQFIKIGGAQSFRDYVDSSWQYRIPRFNPAFYDYQKLLNFYFGLFGPDNVLVLVFEMLQEQPEKFFERLTNFTGVDSFPEFAMTTIRNEGISDDSIQDLIVDNYCSEKRRAVRDPLPFQITDEIERSIRSQISAEPALNSKDLITQARTLFPDIYKAGNQHVNELMNGDLARYGYDL